MPIQVKTFPRSPPAIDTRIDSEFSGYAFHLTTFNGTRQIIETLVKGLAILDAS